MKYGTYKNFISQEVDLDDPNLTMPDASWIELYRACIRELGYALVYLRYLHPDIPWGQQMIRVEELCHELYRNQNFEDVSNSKTAGRNPDPQFWRSFLYRIQDETENLC